MSRRGPRSEKRGEEKRMGRGPRYLLSGLGRCSECGGPLTVINGRDGNRPMKAYTCAYHRNRGDAVCESSLRRPIESVHEVVIDWIRENLLSEELILATLKIVRQRLAERAKNTSSNVPGLEKDAARL